jgi:hypothetical protein
MGATRTDGPSAAPHAPGDVVVLRELWRGRVWAARPAHVVVDEPALRMFHVPPRVLVLEAGGAAGLPLRLPPSEGWRLRRVPRSPTRVLSFAFPDTPYAVLAIWAPDGSFRGWYVNLQRPLVPSPAGFDTTDLVLDVRIDPDGRWRWKDEDELAEAIARGLLDEEAATRLRRWGERAVEHVVLREPPFDRDWRGWRPDPRWAPPELPPEASLP